MSRIKSGNELEFAVFCIENTAVHLGIGAESVFSRLTEESSILYDYIMPNYEILHTQGKEYIVNDILEVMREKGVLE